MMDYGYRTDKGQIREHNEDSFLICTKEDYVLLAVADGMGGHNAGDLASTLAIEEVRKFDGETGFGGKVEEKLLRCVSNANRRIYEESLTKHELGGMGTTLTLAVLFENRIFVAHVGDSRAYIIKDEILKLTIDHSYVEELKLAGKISDEEARIHPSRNQITRAVGTESLVLADLYHADLKTDSIVLLCSDGLTNMIEEEEILSCVKGSATMQEAADRLTQLANENGGTDNITVVALKIGGDREQAGIGGNEK